MDRMCTGERHAIWGAGHLFEGQLFEGRQSFKTDNEGCRGFQVHRPASIYDNNPNENGINVIAYQWQTFNARPYKPWHCFPFIKAQKIYVNNSEVIPYSVNDVTFKSFTRYIT